eukprot:TRINITY_DN8941_c0_g2_i3.p1 TRINITY_DN8941_c0_g2~~TRINITY_DN8941_c0_g2_i3.p1  ORF type:complete len:308 (+),score=61.10 TRINITY_DN8941_c0_g2_i3:170-1093(+)
MGIEGYIRPPESSESSVRYVHCTVLCSVTDGFADWCLTRRNSASDESTPSRIQRNGSAEEEKMAAVEEKEPVTPAVEAKKEAEGEELKEHMTEGGSNDFTGRELLVKRGIIRKMLLNGSFEEAEEFVRENFPDLWNEDKVIRNSIRALRFIEFFREHKEKEAIEYSAKHFAGEGHFATRDLEGYEQILEIDQLFSLFCYENVEDSPLRHLLLPMQREAVGDYISKRILSTKNQHADTELEIVLKQLIAIQNYKLEEQKINPNFKLKVCCTIISNSLQFISTFIQFDRGFGVLGFWGCLLYTSDAADE